ncbi:MAG: ribulokinase [Planctomycetes bacterium]|nr:ribulokinase [Planctomycetota bacterium]
MTQSTFALGLDLGTSSARATFVRCEDGAEAGTATAAFAGGRDGVLSDHAEPELARQDPRAWLAALCVAVREAIGTASGQRGFAVERIVGIGVDATASTPLPVNARGETLAADPRFADRLAAFAWLWKDHTAAAEAREITERARALRPEYLARCGGVYSSEWFWAKVLRCARSDPEVFAAAHSWVEECDYVTAWLCGAREPRRIRRSICAAGHKAMFAVAWGGLPDAEFLAGLDPRLAALRERLYTEAFAADRQAGSLCADVAMRFGLPAGIPVAVGAIDAHLGAVGAGIRQGDLVKVLGTSTCDMAIVEGTTLPRIDGISGIAPSSIVPGHVGIEAGQSAVGDLYAWCARLCGDRPVGELERDASALQVGSSGLLALDWANGNRCVLVDPELSGLVVGLNLQTSPAELFRALVEATAFGARTIIERIVAGGVPVERVIACGGIARRSALVVQTHADVLDRELHVAGSAETCALGAAIVGAVAAGRFADTAAAQRAMCPAPLRVVRPDPARAVVLGRLFALYQRLHDAFGGVAASVELGTVMKELLAIRRAARAG